ncbi:glycoside hydrolase family 32 protein [Priestia sp. SIMBA_032]|uniref:glycoside hydrolase family 32 protein n=1 Tax=Priestia sp. SIMBA_032 TaxID=3085775 RepID=UPI00397B5245
MKTLRNQHQAKISKAIKSVVNEQESVDQNHWRLQYHVSTPAFWMNDPNGFSFYKGEYHLFYQHHPYSPEWGPMYWGHIKSKDLTYWEHLPIALAPSEEYDQDGCFSGSAVEKDGKLYAMYTGNVWTGDNYDTDLRQVQCLVVSEDGVHFNKVPQNPVINSVPEGDIHPHHFRDPKVWKKDDYYYCVLGSRTKDHEGQVLLYCSRDLLNWEFMNVMAKSQGNLGFMWECPDLFSLDGQDVLVMSPQGMKSEGDLYHNLHQAGYVKGKLDYKTGLLQHEDFQLLDYGFDFYAPQTTEDEHGRRIMVAWMAMWESSMPEQKHNWAGAMTIPRELSTKRGNIISKPIQELKQLRQHHVQYENITVNGEQELAGISGDCYELEVKINAKAASQFGIKLRTDHDTHQETLLTYDRLESLFIFNRDKSGEGDGGIRKAPVRLNNNHLHLHLFVDKSSIEVFVNEGEKVMTSRIYPGDNATGICFFANQEIELSTLNKWNLRKGVSPLIFKG